VASYGNWQLFRTFLWVSLKHFTNNMEHKRCFSAAELLVECRCYHVYNIALALRASLRWPYVITAMMMSDMQSACHDRKLTNRRHLRGVHSSFADTTPHLPTSLCGFSFPASAPACARYLPVCSARARKLFDFSSFCAWPPLVTDFA